MHRTSHTDTNRYHTDHENWTGESRPRQTLQQFTFSEVLWLSGSRVATLEFMYRLVQFKGEGVTPLFLQSPVASG